MTSAKDLILYPLVSRHFAHESDKKLLLQSLKIASRSFQTMKDILAVPFQRPTLLWFTSYILRPYQKHIFTVEEQFNNVAILNHLFWQGPKQCSEMIAVGIFLI